MPRVDIVFSQRGARTVSRDVNKIGKSAKESATAVDFLKTQLKRIGAALAIREFIKLSDVFNQANNQLRVLGGTIAVANRNLEELFDVSNRTRTPIETNVALFQKMSLAQIELGASSDELIGVTETIGQLLAIQGGSANSARGALIQLGQAFGAGIVRAEEFNAILEGGFPIAQAAARGIDRAGGSVAKLRKLIIEGEITSVEFFRAIQSQGEVTQVTFDNTSSTIGQAFTVLRNNIIQMIGEFNNLTGANTLFVGVIRGAASAVGFLAKNLDVLIGVTQALLVLWIAINRNSIVATITRLTGSMIAATVSTVAFGKAQFAMNTALFTGASRMKALQAGVVSLIRSATAALLANPYLALGAAILVAAGALFGLRDRTFEVGNATVTLSALAEEAFSRMPDLIDDASLALSLFFQGFDIGIPSIKDMGNAIIATFKTAGDFVIATVNIITNTLFQLVATTGAIFGAIPAAIQAALTGGVGAGADVLRKAFTDSLVDVPDEAANFGKIAGENFSRDFIGEATDAIGNSEFFQSAASRVEGGATGAGSAGSGGDPEADQKAIEAAKKFAEALRDVQEQLDPSKKLVREYSESQAILNEAFRRGSIDLAALRENTSLLIDETTGALESLQDTSAIDAMTEGIRSLASELQPLTELSLEYLDSVNLLNEAFELGLITGEEFQLLFAGVNQVLADGIEAQNDFANPQTFTDWANSAKSAFGTVLAEMGNVEKAFEGLITQGINGLSTAITELALTGKADFAAFGKSIIATLLQVIIKLIIVKALQAATGVGGAVSSAAGAVTSSVVQAGAGTAQSQATAARANGGPVQSGREFLVGENGPEKFVPPTTGQVVSNANMLQQQEPPQVNVSITNVTDPKEVVNGIETREGETAIMNILGKNRGKLKNLAAG